MHCGHHQRAERNDEARASAPTGSNHETPRTPFSALGLAGYRILLAGPSRHHTSWTVHIDVDRQTYYA
jgi:hypothetical protein